MGKFWRIALILVLLPFGTYGAERGSASIASYTSTTHGVVVWPDDTTGTFIVVYQHRAVQLKLTGSGFLKSAIPVPDRQLVETAVKTRRNAFTKQIKSATQHPDERYLLVNKFAQFGYRVVQYASPISAGGGIRAVGTKITVARNNCRWTWATDDFGVTQVHLFKSYGKTYIGVVMYSMGADGYGPAIRVFGPLRM